LFGKAEYNHDMARLSRLPLFPLHTVLFPSQTLPLHIFEPRYRLMIDECLANQLSFGVVLIREGKEVGEEAVPFDVGTTARLEHVERLDDGRFNLLCVGESRFKLTGLRHDRPFLSGDADVWPWAPLATDNLSRVLHLKRLLTIYIQRLAQAIDNTIRLDEMPTEPAPLANLAAIALQIPNVEKQALLAAPTLAELIDGCARLLQRENRALKIAAALPLISRGDAPSFSPN
jgi:Lon protease-like protein